MICLFHLHHIHYFLVSSANTSATLMGKKKYRSDQTVKIVVVGDELGSQSRRRFNLCLIGCFEILAHAGRLSVNANWKGVPLAGFLAETVYELFLRLHSLFVVQILHTLYHVRWDGSQCLYVSLQ